MAAEPPSSLSYRTTGSTCLHPLSELLGIPLDQVNFVACQLFALFAAFWFRIYLSPGKTSPDVRHAFATIFGIYFVIFCFGWYSLHLFVLVLMCYGLMVTASISNIHRYSFFCSNGIPYNMPYQPNIHLPLWNPHYRFFWAPDDSHSEDHNLGIPSS